MSPRTISKKRWVLIAAGVIVAGAVAAYALRATPSTVSAMADSATAVPTSRVVRGALQLDVHLSGDLRASRQQAITAPPVGGSLRILTLVDAGSLVKQGDLLVSFDPADQRYALEQAESELLEAEQNILKRRADTGAQAAQDEVALLTARFNVRRAELDAVVDLDLIPANEHQIRQVSLQEARRTQVQTEQDVLARAAVNKAGLSVQQEARMKAQMAADRARQNMDMLEITSPIDGAISVRDNMDAAGGVIFSGMSLPAYRVGDTVNPGRPVLDVFDVSGMEIRAEVNEQERANVVIGQVVMVSSDSAPGVQLTAKVQAVSGLGRAEIQEGPLRRFDVTLELETGDVRLKPGTSVALVVKGPTIDDALILPRQAVFEQDGKPVVYVRGGSSFQPREVKVLHRSESRVAVEGVDEGVEVALIRPVGADTGENVTAPSAPGTAAAPRVAGPPPPPAGTR